MPFFLLPKVVLVFPFLSFLLYLFDQISHLALGCLLFAHFIGTKSCCLAFSLTSYLTFWCCWTSNWDLIHVTLAVEDANNFFLQISEDNAWCHLNIVTLFYCPYRFHRLLCCHPSLQASSLSGSLGCFENAKVFTFLMGLIGPLCSFLKVTSKSMHKAAFLINQFVLLFLNLCYFLANPAFLLWP